MPHSTQPQQRPQAFWLLHLVLMPVFFILKMMNEYSGLYHTALALKWMGIYVTGSLVLTGLLWLLSRNLLRSAVQTQVVLSLFFYFGYGHGVLKQLFPDSILSKYVVVLPAVLVLLIVLLWLTRKAKAGTLQQLNRYLLLVYTIFTAIEGVQAFRSQPTLPKENTPLVASHPNRAAMPNVYFIIFDEYPSSMSLLEKHGFTNPLDSLLAQKQFFVSRSSRSSYDMTPLSMGSTLNMNFLPLRQQEERLSRLYLTGMTAVRHNRVFEQFQALDYQVVNNSIFDINGFPCMQEPRFTYFDDYIFYYQTLPGKIHDDIWFNVVLNPKVNQFYDFKTARMKKELEQFRNVMTLPLNRLKSISHQTPDSPLFVYSHIVSPHQPLVYDRHGNFDTTALLKPFNGEAFVEQIRYVNGQIDTILTQLQASNAGKPYVIILQGDHGEGESLYTPTYGSTERYKNLNAWYFSDGDYSRLYEGISSVNTFRVVFNKYFNANRPMLPDSSVFIQPR